MDTDGDPECLDYVWVRGVGPGRLGAAGVRPAGSRGPDALPERPPRDRDRARDRLVAGRGVDQHAPPRASRRLARGAREHAGGVRARRSRSRPATVSSWTSAGRPTGCPVVYHDETLQRLHGRPDRVDALTVDALDALGIPTLADILLAVGRRVVPRHRAEGRSGAGRRRGAGSRPRSRTDEPRSSPRSIRSPWSGSPTSRRPGRAGSTAGRWTGRRWPWRSSSAAGRSPSIGDPSTCAPWPWRDAAGLDVAACTVRRRPTFDRLARLGVVAVCVEAAALDG